MSKIKYYSGFRILVFIIIVFLGAIFKFLLSSFSLLNLSLLIVASLFLLITVYYSFSPMAEYDEKGVIIYPFFKLSKPKELLWQDVKEVFSMKETYSTWIVAYNGQTWIVNSGNRNNYFDTLRDILKYLPEEKFDELTLKRAKGPKKRYFI